MEAHKGLARTTGAVARISSDWLPREPQLPRDVFREGLRLLRSASSRPLTRDAVTAYWIVAARFGVEDYRRGVQSALEERWISPAVLAEHCEEARRERLERERAARPRGPLIVGERRFS